MQFKQNKAIYLQIAELIMDDIMCGRHVEEERLPSVREYAAQMEVNVNTCVKTYDWLQTNGIIYTKRGLGYFVCEGARAVVMNLKRNDFLGEMLPDVARQMMVLGISIEEMSNELKRIMQS